MLTPGTFEEGYGTRVSLGAVDPNSIRSLDKKSFDAISQHTRQQADRGASTAEYGLDLEQDFVRAVTGTPRDTSLGSRITGMDALAVTAKVALSDLPSLLLRHLELYSSRAYREHFPWIDQIAEVTDKALLPQLDELLVSAVRAEGAGKLWLAIPQIVDWSDIGGFKYTSRADEEPHEDLDLATFLETVRDRRELTIERLRDRQIHCLNAAAEIAVDHWPVLKCLYFETRHEGHAYVLTDGRWYRVNPDYLNRINADFRQLQESDLILPPYQDPNETAYNRRVAEADPTLALMDRRNIHHGGGHSAIEFCDLYSRTRQLVHVKRYGTVAAFSHLFAQGLTSAELFHGDPEFREKVNALLPASHQFPNPRNRLECSDYQVIFGIITAHPSHLELPLFSKIGLVRATKRIAAYGYRVFYKAIPAASGS
jgi:uncharacterized protein (TIGR04141 family)